MTERWRPPVARKTEGTESTSPSIPVFRTPALFPPPLPFPPPPRLEAAVAALPGAEAPDSFIPTFSQLKKNESAFYPGQVALMAIDRSGLDYPGIYLGTIEVAENKIVYFDPNGDQRILSSSPDGKTNILIGRKCSARGDNQEPKGSANNAHIITINDNDVSRFHVSISIQDNVIQITDQSTYGTAAAGLLFSSKNTQCKMGERTIKVRLPASSVTIS